MIHIEFSEEEIELLYQYKYLYPHPKVQKRMEALYLKSKKLPHHQICKISEPRLVMYLRKYQLGGIEELKKLNYKGQESELNQYR